MDERSIGLAALTSTVAARFIRDRRRSHSQFVSIRSLQPILAFLSSAGAISLAAAESSNAKSAAEALLGRYLEYLDQERGLAATTRESHEHFARLFLAAHHDVRSLAAANVTGFLLRVSKRYTIGSTKVITTVVRSFLRYLYVTGQVKVDLRGAVPAIAGWRLAGLPKALARHDVDLLLQGCDQRTSMGKRDFAILLLLARLGLRACEVRALSLDDIRWAEGVIVIRGKGSVISELPFPAEVGRALVAYLRVRGRPQTRRLFLRTRAPFREVGPTAVTQVVLRASRRAGLVPIHSHRLRHTVATEMLRQGGSLAEIAHALRHRNTDTTAIYAKVDTTNLRDLARPWPGRSP
jgi:site-specific recombinase XerD